MSYNYEQSIWGRGVASLKWSSPTSFRLRQSLQAIRNLPPQSSVLEIGCGAGQFIRAIKQLRPELVCHGCDISQEALRMAREDSREDITYAFNEGCTLPYENNSMDAVLIFDVLEHVDNPEKLLSEVQRVLKPQGILYMFVPCEGDGLSFWHWLDKLGQKHDLTKKHAGHINYFSRKELLRLVYRQGFTKNYIRYSEHFLGQLLGILSFNLMERAAQKQKGRQLNNETYFTTQMDSSIIQTLKSLVNSLIFLESYLFSYLPSPNVHMVVHKT